MLASSDGQPPGAEAGPQDHPEAGMIDAPSNLMCYGTGGLFVGCVTLPQPMPVMLTGNIDTDTDERCVRTSQPSGPEVCMISSTGFMVPGAVRVTGGRPLVLLATDSIMIMGNGSIDVSSGKAGTGAGFDSTDCGTAMGATQFNSFGGGGAGGSFKTQGGAGGKGADGFAHGATAANDDVPAFVRGGCVGSAGAGTTGGAPGDGGGALYLLAANTVQVDGMLIANGAGGSGATVNGGGGGAGSGGLIGIMATTIKGGSNGRMFANGGGGGGGGSGLGGMSGADGAQTLSTQATGGAGGANAGTGGGGGVNTTVPAPGQDNQAGGGGGGGGTGTIYFNGAASMFVGETSPPFITP